MLEASIRNTEKPTSGEWISAEVIEQFIREWKSRALWGLRN
jgi:hypothetical protein